MVFGFTEKDQEFANHDGTRTIGPCGFSNEHTGIIRLTSTSARSDQKPQRVHPSKTRIPIVELDTQEKNPAKMFQD